MLNYPQHMHCVNNQYCIYEINAVDYNTVNVLMPRSDNDNDTTTTQLSLTQPIQRCFQVTLATHTNNNVERALPPKPNPAFEPPQLPARIDMPYKPIGYIDNNNTDNKYNTRNGIAHASRTFQQNNGKLPNESIKPEPISDKKKHKHKHDKHELSSSDKQRKKHKKHKADD